MTASRHPQLLVLCDFPPSHFRGGTILMRRLLAEWPSKRLAVLASSQFDRAELRASYLPCAHYFVSMTDEFGRWGLGRLKRLINWLLLPVVALVALLLLKRIRPAAILSVAHGRFFLVAALVSACTGTPLLLAIHDDWLCFSVARMLGPLAAPLLSRVYRQADAIYVVSEQMQQQLRREYGLPSALQMPAREAAQRPSLALASDEPLRRLSIIYLGTLNAAVDDAIALVVAVMRGEQLRAFGLETWTLTIYTQLPEPTPPPYSEWPNARVQFRPWLNQEQLDAVMAEADLLLLPFAFREDQRPLTLHSFPSKTADYLASGRPVLIVAPPDTSLAVYGQRHGFAEVVTVPEVGAIAAAIGRIALSPAYRARLQARATATFVEQHDIARQRARLLGDIEALRADRRRGAARGASWPR